VVEEEMDGGEDEVVHLPGVAGLAAGTTRER
jgi:hypothetical protein